MTGLFLNRDPSDKSIKWKEWEVQAWCVTQLRRKGFIVHGDQNAGKRNPGKAAVSGMLAGFPDLSVWALRGRVALFELKVDAPVSKTQSSLHKRFKSAGFDVYVVRGKTPTQCWDQIWVLVQELGLEPDQSVRLIVE